MTIARTKKARKRQDKFSDYVTYVLRDHLTKIHVQDLEKQILIDEIKKAVGNKELIISKANLLQDRD